eukprot:scaffold316668_cov14-Tisochrysis_lutea.AAC.1
MHAQNTGCCAQMIARFRCTAQPEQHPGVSYMPNRLFPLYQHSSHPEVSVSNSTPEDASGIDYGTFQ